MGAHPRRDHERSGRPRWGQLIGRARGRRAALERLYLGSVDQCVATRDLDRPEVAVLVVEDLCWRIAVEGWHRRKPMPWRRRARAAWRQEGDVLRAKQDRIVEMAGDTGLRI